MTMRVTGVLLFVIVMDLCAAVGALAQERVTHCCKNSIGFYSGATTNDESTGGEHPLVGAAIRRSLILGLSVQAEVTHVWSNLGRVCTGVPCGGPDPDPLNYIAIAPSYQLNIGRLGFGPAASVGVLLNCGHRGRCRTTTLGAELGFRFSDHIRVFADWQHRQDYRYRFIPASRGNEIRGGLDIGFL